MVGFDLEGPAISNLLTLPRNSEKSAILLCVSRREKFTHSATQRKRQALESTQVVAFHETGTRDSQT